MSNSIKIGLFGMGIVGTGVLELLAENQAIIEKRVGKPVRVVKAVVSDTTKQRKADVSSIDLGTEPEHILDDPETDIVLELIGGLKPAEDIILTALKKGKSVVTANKALLAEKALSIFPSAYEAGGCFGFEASVGSGIPIIRTLREGFSGDEIQEITGILNGTANYILTRMTEDSMEFDEALKDAQNLGYAEADPTFDIEGNDAAHKLIILMSLAFNGLFDYKKLFVEGISGITASDIEYARELGYKVKLLGKACKTGQGIEARVHPALVPDKHMLASVSGAFNAVSVLGNFVGPSVLYGLGAGAHPAAAAVVADIIEACRFILTGQKKPIPPFSAPREHIEPTEIVSMEKIRGKYYLRFNVHDLAGVLAQIAKILGDNQISILSVIQKGGADEPEKPVAIVMVTHESVEENIQKALGVIDKLPFVTEKTQLIRINS